MGLVMLVPMYNIITRFEQSAEPRFIEHYIAVTLR